ncbi:MAG: metal-sulfur cluster assembly factor [Gemmatimonadota bacterium]|nr:metal-sulfur cluster assembly factor [Gemmatimonadota bacterium]
METAPRDPGVALRMVLTEVLDPELPISILDLGLVYRTSISDGKVRIELTFTATACPCMDFIKEDIRDRLLQESWIREVHIAEVWDPPWTTDRITPAGRQALKKLGVGA